MGKSDIEWTDETWNPTRGCEVCSPGCANCYAMRIAGRFRGPGLRYEGLTNITKKGSYVWNGETVFDPAALAKPLKWAKPRRVFVNSMSDLYYDGFTFEQISAVYGVMAVTPHITYQVLTKRARRRNEFQKWLKGAADPARTRWSMTRECVRAAMDHLETDGKRMLERVEHRANSVNWPLKNVWEGVSVENQAAADERAPELLKTEASVRFLSCEPLLEAVDLNMPRCDGVFHEEDWADDGDAPWCNRCDSERSYGHWLHLDGGIDWVIAGCESGPKRRPCEDAWLRALRDQCNESGTAFFLKQAYRNGLLESLPLRDGVRHAEFPTP